MPIYDTSMPACRGIDIQDLSIADLQGHMRAGDFSASDLTACFLDRIGRLNGLLKAVIEVNPDALDIARQLDDETRQGTCRGPLHGIPFLVKDNIATNDKMATTAGSSDRPILRVLKLFPFPPFSSEGYSARGGQCRNPYNLARHPGGSSCGSAVAVSVSMCAFSLGTETDGSVMFPADRNGVVGFKPSLGRTSCRGVIPESHNFDVVGTFGKTVADAALALDAILEPGTGDESVPPLGSFVSTKSALQGARFGIPWKKIWEAAAAPRKGHEYRLLMEAVDRIKAAGAIIVSEVDFPSADEIMSPSGWDWDFPSQLGRPNESEFTVVKTDFYNDLKEYLSSLRTNPTNVRTLEDIIAYNRERADDEGGIPGRHGAWPLGQDNFERSAASKGVEDDVYEHALEFIQRKSRSEGIDAALGCGGQQLDGLLVPVQADGGAATQLAAKAGYPMITIPISTKTNGVPFGLAIMQTAGREDLLVRYGSAIEDLNRGRPKADFRNIDADNYMYVGAEPGQ
ncbi:related to amidase family protein [Cephalotrichum gorgonifer]|uniref:Related to amidase family protein n=1 Tax=Cephalotrichum gorgonifer TaxID=2041049 RepID=A0AAE8N2K7_9PEZI|nr:related to amidase family protein [Cephalotrichum gorgonifer]